MLYADPPADDTSNPDPDGTGAGGGKQKPPK